MKKNKRMLAVDRLGISMCSRLHFYLGFRGMYFGCIKNKGYNYAVMELKKQNELNDDNN